MEIFEAIDWTRPWLAALRPIAESILSAQDWRAAMNRASMKSGLQNHLNLPIRFVPQSTLPAGIAYEAFISATGQVPTRENLHDFFNALIWLSFPNIKRQLNALQAKALSIAAGRSANGEGKSTGTSRGKLRDAATIFDENAALLIIRNKKFLDEIRQHHWNKTFIDRRLTFFQQCEVQLFGHAIIEKLVTPYKAITAHAWPVLVNDDYFTMSQQDKQRWIDHTVASQLQSGLIMADFTPLPVLGIPGWWADQNADFYNDVNVFRPAKGVVTIGAKSKTVLEQTGQMIDRLVR